MATTLFELEVNEFCDGFPVVNSKVADKLFSTFNNTDSYGLLMNLLVSALAMEEEGVQYAVSEVPAKFTYSFVGKPVLTEDFLRKFSEFFNNGHTSEISELLSRLQDTYKGVVLRRFSDEQLEYVVELLLMVHDAVYSKDYYGFWMQRIAEHVSNDLISEVFDQRLSSLVKSFENNEVRAELKRDVVFVKDQLLMREIVELLVFVRKCSKNGLFHDLLLLHEFVVSFVSSFDRDLKFEGYEYDVMDAASQDRGVYQSLASATVDASSFHDNVFRYELSEFDNRGIPFMTVDFIKYMYEFFGGGHSAELRKVLRKAVLDAVKFEKSASSKNWKKFSRSPVFFTYGFGKVHEDGYKYHLDEDFLYHLDRFFRGGNTECSSNIFWELKGAVGHG